VAGHGDKREPNMSEPVTDEDKRLFAEVRAVHEKVAEELQKLYDLPILIEVGEEPGLIGTLTALMHHGLFFDACSRAVAASRAKGKPEELDFAPDREWFVQLAGDCWDDFHDFHEGKD
jgi:hypothetical protein